MKKVLGLLLALALVVGACGDDNGDGGLTDPAEAQSCDELVDVLFNIIQAAIDSVSDMSVTEFMDLADGSLPPEIARMDTMGEALEARASVLGCSARRGPDRFLRPCRRTAGRLRCRQVARSAASQATADHLTNPIPGQSNSG